MASSLDYPHMEDHSTHDHGESSPETTEPVRGYAPNGHAAPGGLAVAANGVRLDPAETRFTPGTSAGWTFRIVDDDGAVVTDFEEAHGERSHLVVVGRDLTRFQHLHPELKSDGTWRVDDFALPDPGVYRAFVDIVVGGQPTTLGFDLFASGPGTETVAERPDSSRRATADGYDVELLTDEVAARESSRLTFEVRRDGDPVSKLEEYLGALGHLVALREGDLAYLHVHPEETEPGGGRVAFHARFPTPGRYRLFLQTRPEGELVTTAFDVRIRR
ncbi:FixH family protein [Haloprofundus salinisoli]|uniref:FixH family protein n=1 Tax=Haloprofundus salinisoli TaxID=2876193 RepID=UPI001CCFC206|nr:FixH family protein [Haloprofundus salinisoli]